MFYLNFTNIRPHYENVFSLPKFCIYYKLFAFFYFISKFTINLFIIF